MSQELNCESIRNVILILVTDKKFVSMFSSLLPWGEDRFDLDDEGFGYHVTNPWDIIRFLMKISGHCFTMVQERGSTQCWVRDDYVDLWGKPAMLEMSQRPHL